MSGIRFGWLIVSAALALSPLAAASAQQSKLEKTSIKIAVGGKSALFYLPLSVTERLGPVYVKAIAASKAMYSPDGHFLPGAAQTAYDVLKEFNPPVAAAKIDLSKTYTDRFVEQAARTVK